MNFGKTDFEESRWNKRPQKGLRRNETKLLRHSKIDV